MPSVQNYRELEAALKTAGPAWTIVRLNIGLADALARDVVWGRQAGEIAAPAQGASAAPAAVSDLAAATAIAVTSPRYEGEVLELTGPDDIDWNDLPAAAGVPLRAVSDEEYAAYLSGKFGLPAGNCSLAYRSVR